MTAPSTSDGASAGPMSFVRALPGCVVFSGLVTLPPILVLLDVLVLLAHLPTFIVLLAYAIDLARSVREDRIVSPIVIAGFVGGFGASVALMGLMAIAVLQDATAGMLYFFTAMLLPILAVVGSGLAAAAVGLGRLVFRRSASA